MPHGQVRTSIKVGLGLVLSLATVLAQAVGFNSGSTGADGALNVTTDTTLTLPANGVFNYTTVNVAAGSTLRFTKNASNTPVVLLTTGDVTIAGVIDISGGNAQNTNLGSFGDTSLSAKGGPGGFDGGRGGAPGNNVRGGNGLGPGGGGGGDTTSACCQGVPQGGGGGGYATAGDRNAMGTNYDGSAPNTGLGGSAYGSILVPLLGGSGGGGGGGARVYTGAFGAGGAGGGGAILIVSSGFVRVTGSINASGGTGGWVRNCDVNTTCGGSSGGGSGGAVRILARDMVGSVGGINVSGGSAGPCGISYYLCSGSGAPGRVRYEVLTAGTYTPPGMPTLLITSVGGIAVSATPTGNQDVVLPQTTPNPVTVGFATTNVPVGSTVVLTLNPVRGAAITANSSALAGTSANAVATASINVPDDLSTLSAQVSYTLTVAMGDSLSTFAQGERVEKITLIATLGGAPQATLVTVSGKQYPAPQAALLLAGFAG